MQSREWYNAAGERWCVTCRVYVAVELFHHERGAAPDGLARECRVCRRRIGRAAYRAHPERRQRASARAMAWQAQHPERARALHRQAQRTYAARQQYLVAQGDSDPSAREREQREEQAAMTRDEPRPTRGQQRILQFAGRDNRQLHGTRAVGGKVTHQIVELGATSPPRMVQAVTLAMVESLVTAGWLEIATLNAVDVRLEWVYRLTGAGIAAANVPRVGE